MAAAGPKSRRRAPRPGDTKTMRAVDEDRLASGNVSQEEHPDSAEEESAGDQNEAGVAECEFEANTPTRCSSHDPLHRAACSLYH